MCSAYRFPVFRVRSPRGRCNLARLTVHHPGNNGGGAGSWQTGTRVVELRTALNSPRNLACRPDNTPPLAVFSGFSLIFYSPCPQYAQCQPLFPAARTLPAARLPTDSATGPRRPVRCAPPQIPDESRNVRRELPGVDR